MPTDRSYGDGCGIARALDVVGERWALLVVRELLLGPQRFSDLRRALPGASSNVVADRLRELEGRGVVERHRLPPPAGAWVYELTDWGRRLEPIVLALGTWGLGAPPPAPAALSPTSVLLYLRSAARPAPEAPPAAYRLQLDESVWAVHTAAGRVRVAPGEPPAADAGLRTTPATLNALLADPAALGAAVADGRAAVTGDPAALQRLLRAVADAPPANVPPAACPTNDADTPSARADGESRPARRKRAPAAGG